MTSPSNGHNWCECANAHHTLNHRASLRRVGVWEIPSTGYLSPCMSRHPRRGAQIVPATWSTSTRDTTRVNPPPYAWRAARETSTGQRMSAPLAPISPAVKTGDETMQMQRSARIVQFGSFGTSRASR
ncbi:uncharacterized protein N7459_002485 [Penicillium hispanicum]|uniref:uncharacterized protein n=1 Tax=Penicillium hispanicum TaxID=1080232 RepID=UPI002540F3CB|nr:uncharacterized protein N7459_002485 [Penicillium hispanicum]KAJ5586720.1 hypothetical protein N7459_002485 [Penicillium hispanicum]